MVKAKNQCRAAKHPHQKKALSASLLPQDLQCIPYLRRHIQDFSQICTIYKNVRRMAHATADIRSVSNPMWGMVTLGVKALRRQAITFLRLTERRFCVHITLTQLEGEKHK